MMDSTEDTSVEKAIEWLVQAILASLVIGSKLIEWIGKVGLGSDIQRLKSEVEGVKTMVSAVKERATRSKTLAQALVPLKEQLYDANDVVDELDYWRLQEELDGGAADEPQVERCGENADEHAAPQFGSNIPINAVGKRRSKVWEHFRIINCDENGKPAKAGCNYCHEVFGCKSKNGTSTLKSHLGRCKKRPMPNDQPLNPSSRTGDATTNATPVAVTTFDTLSSRKRIRVEETAYGTGSNTNHCNKEDFSKRIQNITGQLQDFRGKIRGILKMLGQLLADSGASSNHCLCTASDPRPRSSSIAPNKLLGRNAEKNSIIQSMSQHRSPDGITVLPIVGIAGVGKTALAQLVYNDPAVKSQFHHRIWISVSNNFNEMRLTREMLDFISQGTHEVLCSFAKLQEVLEGHIKSKRVLLILDDVWNSMDDFRWNRLLAPFKSDNAKGHMVLVTTRKPSVAESRGTAKPIKLDALKKAYFWQFFKACAFGDENYEEPASLSDLGQLIAEKLMGNPLSAETAGALLREHLTYDHWSNTLKNEEWKSLHLRGGIMPALKLCYDELPGHLQQCFSFCSIFPNNYQFLAEELVAMWISQGFVKSNDSNKRLEDIGRYYLTDLVNLGFFEQVERKEISSGSTQICYAMCGLMHDFARVVSRTDCATMDGFQCNRIFPNVRHLSVLTNSVYQREEQTWNIARSKMFEEKLRNTVSSVRKLKSLVLIGSYDSFFFQSFKGVFQKAHNLCLLQMSATSADFNSFLCSLVNPTRLRYLKLQDVRTEVLDVLLFESDRLNFLRTLHLVDCGRWQILPCLRKLPFLIRLKLSNMQKVREILVPPLEELILDEMPELERCSCTSVGDLNSSLRLLEIQRCPTLKVFDLFQKCDTIEIEYNSWLPGLRKLIIHGCPDLQVLNPLPPSSTCCEFLISRVSTFPRMEGFSKETLNILPNSFICKGSVDKILAIHNLRDLKCLSIVSWIISFKSLSQLIWLKRLELKDSDDFYSADVLPEHTHDGVIAANCIALPSLKSLIIESCSITGKWLSLMLRHAPTLKELDLFRCRQFMQLQIADDSLTSSDSDRLCRIPLNLTSSLKRIAISCCPDITFDGSKEGFARLTTLDELTIRNCPEPLSSLVHNDGNYEQANGRWLLPQSIGQLKIHSYSHQTLLLYCLGNFNRLKKLEVLFCSNLKFLQLHSCSSLEDLSIVSCRSLAKLEILQSLVNLRNLKVLDSPCLPPLLERLSCQGYELCPRLESLETDDLSLLTSSFCNDLSSLQRLQLQNFKEATRLTNEQERAILLPQSMQQLQFVCCSGLTDLPAGLHGLSTLKTLMIKSCPSISRLPEGGLPPSLEELELSKCRNELSEQCRLLSTSKLKVKIAQ